MDENFLVTVEIIGKITFLHNGNQLTAEQEASEQIDQITKDLDFHSLRSITEITKIRGNSS